MSGGWGLDGVAYGEKKETLYLLTRIDISKTFPQKKTNNCLIPCLNKLSRSDTCSTLWWRSIIFREVMSGLCVLLEMCSSDNKPSVLAGRNRSNAHFSQADTCICLLQNV